MLTRKMKDSGIEWIGEIPVNWKISKVGSHFTERNEKVSALDYKPLSVTKRGILPQLEEAAKSSNPNNRKLVLPNDFVINSRSDRKMSSGLSDLEGSVSLINTVLYSKTIDKNYTKYLLKNYGFAEEFYKWGSGIVADLWSTRWNEMKNIPIPIPPKETQVKIGSKVDFLNNKIDNLINNTLLSIEELKKYKQSLITEAVTKGLNPHVEMKDSGIEWIGKIPKHWEVIKLKYLTEIRDEKREFSSGDIYVGLENVLSHDGELKDIIVLEKSSREQAFLKGDILYSKLRPYLAKAFIAGFDGSCSGEFIVLKNYKGVKEHLLYWLINYKFTTYINSTTYGAKMPRSSWDNIKETLMPYPGINEQKEIIKYINQRTSIINKLIANKQQVIKELESYKKSLIYEYVTGKKTV